MGKAQIIKQGGKDGSPDTFRKLALALDVPEVWISN